MEKPLQGKRALILGLANERSIAWGIAQALHEQGAKLAFNYLGEALEKRVRPLAESLNAEIIAPCDVSSDEQIAALFSEVGKKWGGLDILVHSVAFANRDDLHGRFVDVSRAGFKLALDVSAYSLVATAREAEKLMPVYDPTTGKGGGTVLTLTYYGSEKVIPGYGIMGVAKAALEASVRYLANDLGLKKIRVHAISAGPIKTLAAAGGVALINSVANIGGFLALHKSTPIFISSAICPLASLILLMSSHRNAIPVPINWQGKHSFLNPSGRT